MSLTRTESNPFELLRPFVWLAVFAFFVGFAAYVVAGAGGSATAHGRAHLVSPFAAAAPIDGVQGQAS